LTINPPRLASAAEAVSRGFLSRLSATHRTPASLLATAVLGQVILAMCSPGLRAQDLRIEHVSIVSPERPGALRDAEVDIHDGRIAAITGGNAHQPEVGGAPKPTTINARGLYLTPGLIDSHVHLGEIPGMTGEQESKNPEVARAARNQIPHSFLLYGFTTLVDLISTPSAMARWKSHDPVPDTYFCGAAALMDGYPMNFAPKPGRYEAAPYMLIAPGAAVPAGIDPAQHTPVAVVAKMKADGAICVKAFYERGWWPGANLPVPTLEMIRELVGAAHQAGLPVLLHANSQEAQEFGLKAGVDILAHGLWNWDVPGATTQITPPINSILDRVLSGHVGWQPTIQVLYGIRDLFDPGFLANPALARVLPRSLIDWYGTREGQWFHDDLAADFGKSDPSATRPTLSVPIARVEAATGYLARRGALLLFGTDTPSAPTYANPPGLNGWLEMQHLIDAGLTPRQIFLAATLSNAQALHLNGDVGTVEVGKRANLLLLKEDPTKTIQAYAHIVKIILGGRMLEPAQLTANHARPGPRLKTQAE
jgi:imidazolonepropionase-like amidohydrolase